jgi:hypothetical protein
MAFGTFAQGSGWRVKLGTTASPATLVGGLQNVQYDRTRETSTDDFMNGQASDDSVGKANRRITLTGKVSQGDDGLAIAETAFNDDTGPIIYAEISQNGTTGEILPVRVSGFPLGLPNVNQKGTYTITLTQAGAPVDSAGGGILEAA